MKKVVYLAALGLFSITSVIAQGEESSFTSTGRGGVATTFASDYEAIGLNPANLGMKPKYEGKNISLGLTEFGASIYSEALAKPDLRSMVFGLGSGDTTSFTTEQKAQAAADFVQSPLAMNFDLLNIGFSVYNEKFGGIGFTVKDRISWYSEFNSNFSEMLFLGYNASYFDQVELTSGLTIPNDPDSLAGIDPNDIVRGLVDSAQGQLLSELFDGTRMSLNWYKEYNLTYGREFELSENAKLYGGVGIKYIQGIASMDLNVENGSFTDSYVAMSPGIPVNYGGLGSSGIGELDTINDGLFGVLPEAVGTGMGLDLGFNILLGELDIGFAVTDIGSVTYDRNIYAVEDIQLFDLSSQGLDNYNLFEGAADFTSNEGVVQWSQIQSKKVNLPTVARAGVSFTHELSDDRKVEVGGDIVLPLNKVAGAYRKPMVGIGGDISILKWLNISSGIVFGGSYGFNLPAGITIDIGNGTWEMGVASRDVYTFFTNTGPTLSLSTGFLRFRI